MKRSPRLTQGFTRTLNPKLERFIRVNPTAVELIRKNPSLGPQNGKWLKRASFIVGLTLSPSLYTWAHGLIGLSVRVKGSPLTLNPEPESGLTLRLCRVQVQGDMLRYRIIYRPGEISANPLATYSALLIC